MTLLCKKIIVAISRRSENQMAQSSKKGYGSKRAVLPVIRTTTMIMISKTLKVMAKVYWK
jgi:hypothetical protein